MKFTGKATQCIDWRNKDSLKQLQYAMSLGQTVILQVSSANKACAVKNWTTFEGVYFNKGME